MGIETTKKLAYLAETKDLIKAALIEKGQAVSDTDTFRSYADKVLAIETGGVTKEVTKANGIFDVTSGIMTVTHKLGMVPDIAIICPTQHTSGTVFVMSVGFSSNYIEQLGGGDLSISMGGLQTSGLLITQYGGIDGTNESDASYGVIRNATDTEFTVGGSIFPLMTDARYVYYLYGGLT